MRFAEKCHRDLEGMPSGGLVLAEAGTMSLEFTRLAQLTGEQKYFDVVGFFQS